METTPSQQIINAIRDLRSGKLTDDEYRSKMTDLRGRLGEYGYNVAKLQAVAADR